MKVLLDVGISPRLRMPLQEALGGGSVESAIFTAGARCETASCWSKLVNTDSLLWSPPTSAWRRSIQDLRLP